MHPTADQGLVVFFDLSLRKLLDHRRCGSSGTQAKENDSRRRLVESMNGVNIGARSGLEAL